MKNKIALFVVIIMLTMMIPVSAFAASHTVGDGETLNLSTGVLTYEDGSTTTLTINDEDTINVEAGATATITGSAKVQISCGAGVDLTLNSVYNDISVKADHYTPLSDTCALSFSGGSTEAEHNTLTLVGISTLRSGKNEPGIRVEGTTSLEINGNGSLTVAGGDHSAGIGGGNSDTVGTITISGGEITAYGGSGNPVYGGGAGIGSGYKGSGVNITISGGKIDAEGGLYGAGIGSGHEGDCDNISIEGGEVTAEGGTGGAGIGSGEAAEMGNIIISGGIVVAVGWHDIGGGHMSYSSGSLSISGEAVVFLISDTCSSSTSTHTHTHLGLATITDGKLYGVTIPGSWSQAGAYILARTLTYDDNGATGTLPEAVTQHVNTTISVENKGDLVNQGHVFTGWNTTADGSGDAYAEGSSFVFEADTTLYAQWDDIEVTLNSMSESLAPGETVQLTATVTPDTVANLEVTWASNNESVATVDSSGLVTAIDEGVAIITATVDDVVYDACDVSVTPKLVESVTLNHTTKDMTIGDTVALSATVTPSDATNPDVTWTSSNASVATVDSNGNVTAVGEGLIVITASADGLSDACAVGVRFRSVTSVTLDSSSKDMNIGDTVALSATVTPSDATNLDVTWTSSNTSVATVDSSGNVTAVGEGLTVITASADGLSDACAVGVHLKPVTSVTLNSSSKDMIVGDTVALSATVTPSDATNPDVTWTSSNTSVATVDSSGKVTAIGEGLTVITASADGRSDACAVGVRLKPVTSVTLNSAAKEMIAGDTVTLKATVTPSDAANADVTWRSTNTSVATVDDSGKVTAIGKGLTVITASAGGRSDACAVGVRLEPVTSVKLSSSSKGMLVGDTATLSVTVAPSDAANPDVTWTSSNASVATVDSSGNVTAIGEGLTVITVSADGQYDVCAIDVSNGEKNSTDTDTKDDFDSQNHSKENDDVTSNGSTNEDTLNAVETGTIIPHHIEEKEDTGSFIVTIHVQHLHEFTKSVQTPSGEIIKLQGLDKVQFEIQEEEIDENGVIEIVMLDDVDVPLSSAIVQIDEPAVNEHSEKRGILAYWWIICIVLLLIVAGIILIRKIKGNQDNLNY